MGNKKTCVITGANSGIGKETAKALAKMGYRIIMVCRNAEKAELAKQEMIASSNNHAVEVMIADLSSLANIKQVSDQLLSRNEPIDVLINNAGGAFYSRQQSNDGFEKTFAVNYLAVFYLTNLLLPLLKASPQGRIDRKSTRLNSSHLVISY